jgi:hypothetical protein
MMLLIIVGIVVLIMFTFFGIFIWTCSDFPLAIREIAINSRHDRQDGSSYILLRIMAVLTKIIAIIFWVCGLFLSFYIVYVSANPNSLPFPIPK